MAFVAFRVGIWRISMALLLDTKRSLPYGICLPIGVRLTLVLTKAEELCGFAKAADFSME